jgi:hypothetical protein
MKILNQKYNRHSKSFEILEDGVLVKENHQAQIVNIKFILKILELKNLF